MSLDLNDLLLDWPHEPGKIKVRKITGNDGRPKLQLRIDLGVLQMEMSGRPAGDSPHGFESLLDYHWEQARAAEVKGGRYVLDSAKIDALQQEGIQYYHRFISLFQLGDYLGVIRDTRRNQEMIAFIARHAPTRELALSATQFMPYAIMMHTRATASLDLGLGDCRAAMKSIEDGIQQISTFFTQVENSEGAANNEAIRFLSLWLDELRKQPPHIQSGTPAAIPSSQAPAPK